MFAFMMDWFIPIFPGLIFSQSVLVDHHQIFSIVDINECQVAETSKPKVDLCRCVYGRHESKCKATCVNTLGSYKCKCSPGFDLVANKVCTDSDECKTGEHKCAHVCWNTHGGYKCSCYPGVALASDGYSCNGQ